MTFVKCSNCGAEIPSGGLFCPLCGKDFESFEFLDGTSFEDTVVLSHTTRSYRGCCQDARGAGFGNLAGLGAGLPSLKLYGYEFYVDGGNVYRKIEGTGTGTLLNSGLTSVSYIVIAPAYLYMFGTSGGASAITRLPLVPLLNGEIPSAPGIIGTLPAPTLGVNTVPQITKFNGEYYIVYVSGGNLILLKNRDLSTTGYTLPAGFASFCASPENGVYVRTAGGYQKLDFGSGEFVVNAPSACDGARAIRNFLL